MLYEDCVGVMEWQLQLQHFTLQRNNIRKGYEDYFYKRKLDSRPNAYTLKVAELRQMLSITQNKPSKGIIKQRDYIMAIPVVNPTAN